MKIAQPKEADTCVHFSVPLVPVSVNHYKLRTRKGVTFVSSEAKAFKDAVAIFARGGRVRVGMYIVTIRIFLGHGQKGDLDNFAKLCLDGLVHAGVIHSDATVMELRMMKSRDREAPRTEFEIESLN